MQWALRKREGRGVERGGGEERRERSRGEERGGVERKGRGEEVEKGEEGEVKKVRRKEWIAERK